MKINDNIELINNTVANAYYLKIHDLNILVDAGTKGSGKKIIKFFDNEKIKPDIVLITHYHPDHTGGLKEIYDKYQPKIYVPNGEIDAIRGIKKISKASTMSKFISYIIKTEKVDNVISVINLDVPDIEHYNTPGHTVDSNSYILKRENIIFSGDAIISKNGKPYINKLFSWNMDLANESMARLLNLKPELILPGHGNAIRP